MELIDPWIIDEKDFEAALQAGEKKCIENIREELKHYSLDDLHRKMSWWACFQSEEEMIFPPFKVSKRSTTALNVKAKKEAKKRKASKKKRKQQKASKRKNRR